MNKLPLIILCAASALAAPPMLLAQYRDDSYPVLEAKTMLMTCESLEAKIPDLVSRLEKLPPIYRARLTPTMCGVYLPKQNVILVSAEPHCPLAPIIIAHELLHWLGYEHHNDRRVHNTRLDDFHNVLEHCVAPYTKLPSRMPPK